MNLDELRAALTDLDGQLLELVARRQALSEQVAAVKRATGRATRDFGREREVILRGRTTAERLKISPDLAESLLRQLILSSLATQEHARVAAQAHGSGKRALVIGGAGKMGGWFAEFLASQGFRVAVAAPKASLRSMTPSTQALTTPAATTSKVSGKTYTATDTGSCSRRPFSRA